MLTLVLISSTEPAMPMLTVLFTVSAVVLLRTSVPAACRRRPAEGVGAGEDVGAHAVDLANRPRRR